MRKRSRAVQAGEIDRLSAREVPANSAMRSAGERRVVAVCSMVGHSTVLLMGFYERPAGLEVA